MEERELEQPRVVTLAQIADLGDRTCTGSAPGRGREIAYELQRRGWLGRLRTMNTSEFLPGARAGAHGSGDRLIELRAQLAIKPQMAIALAMESAAVLQRLAQRSVEALLAGIAARPSSYRDLGGLAQCCPTAEAASTTLTWAIPTLDGTARLSYQVRVDSDAWNSTLRNALTTLTTGGGDPPDPCLAGDECHTTVSPTPPEAAPTSATPTSTAPISTGTPTATPSAPVPSTSNGTGTVIVTPAPPPEPGRGRLRTPASTPQTCSAWLRFFWRPARCAPVSALPGPDDADESKPPAGR